MTNVYNNCSGRDLNVVIGYNDITTTVQLHLTIFVEEPIEYVVCVSVVFDAKCIAKPSSPNFFK